MKIVSYNLRFASENDPHPWSRRRAPMIELLTEVAPDVLGTQEGLDYQLAELSDGLGNRYALVAECRGNVEFKEHSAIFYDTAVVDLVDIVHRWLSDTPDVPGSMTWGATLPRMFSLARFRRRADDHEFFVLTTHFDHAVAEARLKSAHQVRDTIAGLDRRLPLVVMGDFNVDAGSEPYAVLIGAGLRDAYLAAERRGPRLETFNEYRTPDPHGERIDWILVNEHVKVDSARMVDSAPGGQYPSDHLPVEAVVDFCGGAGR